MALSLRTASSASIYLMDAHKKADTKMRGIHFRLDDGFHKYASLVVCGLQTDAERPTVGGGTLASRLQLAKLSALKESSNARFRVRAGQPARAIGAAGVDT